MRIKAIKDLNIKEKIPIKNYTTFKVGGPAEYFFVAKSIGELKDTLRWAKKEKIEVTILGGGSNVVISDKGLNGLVIVNKSDKIKVGVDFVKADSGVMLSGLVAKLLENHKGGIEFLANIPGTVGGAVAVNAGCYRKFVADFLISATIFHNNVAEEVKNDFFAFEYRSSKIKKGYDAVVLDATFEIKDVNIEESGKMIAEDRGLRDTKHPKEPSCGSYFKNPSKENIAGALIEKSGLKGFQIGGAKVSEKHANFLINTGNATASDIFELAQHIKKVVKEKTGFELEEEVKYLGEF